MNIGLGEIIVIIVTLGLLVSVLIIFVLASLLLFRRIRALEDCIEKLEVKHDATSGHSGEPL